MNKLKSRGISKAELNVKNLFINDLLVMHSLKNKVVVRDYFAYSDSHLEYYNVVKNIPILLSNYLELDSELNEKYGYKDKINFVNEIMNEYLKLNQEIEEIKRGLINNFTIKSAGELIFYYEGELTQSFKKIYSMEYLLNEDLTYYENCKVYQAKITPSWELCRGDYEEGHKFTWKSFPILYSDITIICDSGVFSLNSHSASGYEMFVAEYLNNPDFFSISHHLIFIDFDLNHGTLEIVKDEGGLDYRMIVSNHNGISSLIPLSNEEFKKLCEQFKLKLDEFDENVDEFLYDSEDDTL